MNALRSESKIFSTNRTLNVSGAVIDLSFPRVMGILNVTPDSFYDGGQYNSDSAWLAKAEKMLMEGASFIDVGGQSTKPGAELVSQEVEIQRVLPAIRAIKKSFPQAFVSIDSFRSEVARLAVAEGAVMVNDVSGGQMDSRMWDMVARLKVPYVLMHMRGEPKTMTSLNTYDDLMKELLTYFHQRVHRLNELGVADVLIDPGFGFAKNIEQNFLMLKEIRKLRMIGPPLLVGISRKSMIWKTLHTSPEEALNGTSILNTLALLGGASVLRVHDVKDAVEVIKLVTKTMGLPIDTLHTFA